MFCKKNNLCHEDDPLSLEHVAVEIIQKVVVFMRLIRLFTHLFHFVLSHLTAMRVMFKHACCS